MCVGFILIFILFLNNALFAQNAGCRDPKAINYLSSAVINDGSCQYRPTNYGATRLFQLPNTVQETSGLVFYNGYLWTHNDSGGEPKLYVIDPESGQIVREVFVKDAKNIDWEEITIDDQNLYIADIGNNNGNRKDLKIYIIDLDELEQDTVSSTFKTLAYPDQVDFSNRPNNNNNDAESLISIGDQLYIFSKNWVDTRSKIYAMLKSDSVLEPRLVHEWNSLGMITGGTFNPDDSIVVLCGYNKALQPFVWLFWDYQPRNIWSGNQRMIQLNLPFHQVEGITYMGNSEYYFSNESFNTIINTKAAVHVLDTKNWIDSTNLFYSKIDTSTVPTIDSSKDMGYLIYPNPTKNLLNISWNSDLEIQKVEVFNTNGKSSQLWWTQPLEQAYQIDMSSYAAGTYIMVLTGRKGQYYNKFVVRK